MEVTMSMSQVMNNMMVGVVRKVSEQVVEACALKYGFSKEEALRDLNIVVSAVSKKEPVVKAKKMVCAFPLPFNGEHNEMLCQALRQNNGLYTQCQGAKKSEKFCKSCEQLASKSEDGIPEYGTIIQRLACDVLNYTDPKGRKPTPYTKVMKKYKITKEQVLEEAKKFEIQINEVHFVAPEETKRGRRAAEPKEVKETTKGSKGRPKKTTKVVQIDDDDDDLFASLVASANQPLENVQQNEADKEAEKAEKAEKEAKLAADKAEKVAKLAAAKAEKEAKLAAAKAEKEAKLAAEKAEKETKLAKAQLEKEAKLAKAEQEKQEKAAKLATEKAAKEAAKNKKVTPATEEEQEETYKKCGEVNGVKYIRSQQTGIVYDFNKYTESEELVPVGKWNADKKEIIFEKVGDDELSEDEVDDE